MTLSPSQRERYKRHLLLDDFGEEAQQRLLGGSVLVIGAGGLGSPALMYLAAAGVGRIGIADGDILDLSNMQRQVVHDTAAVGRLKVTSAAQRLHALNPDTVLETHACRVTEANAATLLTRYDFVIDATDNPRSKFLINDLCCRLGVPYSHGGIWHHIGQTTTVLPGRSACYRCLFDTEPEPGPPAGPLGVLPGVIGTLQATEAVKYLTGCGRLLTDRLLVYDAWAMTFTEIAYSRRSECPGCR